MADPFVILSKGLLLVLAPVMLLSPFLFVFFYPQKVASDAERLRARSSLFWLGIATACALTVWLAWVTASLVSPQN